MSTSPDPNRQIAAPGRRRTKRACDKCSRSRTKCDGKHPCQHCTNYGFTCSYDREQKPRGRAPIRRRRIESTTSGPTDSVADSHTHSSLAQPIATSASTPATNGGQHSRIEGTPSFPANNGEPSTASDNPTAREHEHPRQATPSNVIQDLYNPRPEYHQQLPNYLQIPQQNWGLANFHGLYFDDPNPENFSQFDHAVPNVATAIFGNGSQGAQGNELDGHGSPLDRARIRPISRIGLMMPGTPQFRPPSAFGKSPSAEPPAAQGCRYLVLVPLLQHINGVLPTSIACDLLDLYFAEASSSLFESASPYVLTHIFRKKSFLHPTKPRATSPALLTAMLWATAQTSDAQIFKTTPTSRARICNRLFAICLRLLNPLLSENTGTIPEKILHTERSHNSAARDGIPSTGTLDDVLTLTLIGIVVSGGDFKRECLKWWRAAKALAKDLKLGQEVDECQTALGAADSPYESTHTSGQSDSMYGVDRTGVSEEDKEERRRTWWLLYIADRHLGLSFNTPLTILDAECHLYQPLSDVSWEAFDPEAPHQRDYGPSTIFTGIGLFEYFLPLMVILGDLIELHHQRNHPRFGKVENVPAISQVQNMLEAYEQSLLAPVHPSDFQTPHLTNMHSQYNLSHSPSSSLNPSLPPADSRRKIVIAYATHILHVLHILLHGKWDLISMLDDLDHWTTSPSFLKCASHSISAAEAVSQILLFDPELSFIPYLFGIYLLHGSFILLLFADKMQIEANPTVRQACETMIRAHEVCVATLNTEYQRNFRKVLRSALYDAKGIGSLDMEEQRVKRREFLSLYRWANCGRGLDL